MEYLVGIVLAIVVSIFATIVGLDRDRGFYPTVMIVIALLYVLFAVMGGSYQALTSELMVSLGFIGVTTLGFKKNLWLVVGALAGHGIYDFVHLYLFSTPGVPSFWPTFCSAYDVVAAGYLAWLLRSTRIAA